jgi:protein-S-isoprenylcysteine O-methyltransferase Ste14
MVDHALGISATLFSRRSDTLGWARVHYCWRAWIVRFVCALCVGGSGYACADRATTQSRGLYRYVRNPIYVAVVAVILGQAVLLADWRLLGYGALLWLFFHIVVITYEEPTLRQSFGAEYESYCANVPRWLPRLTPWRAV